jgi:hypothetical protein
MTLRAYLITLRGRIREALCPELQMLRDRLAHAQDALDDEFDRGHWQAERDWQQRVEPMRAEAQAYKEAYFKLLETVSKVKAMEPGCPVFLATPPQGNSPARRPLTDEEIKLAVLSDPIYGAALMSMMRDGVTVAQLREAVSGIARAIERAHGITGGNDD